jgi:hypothetical protein
MRHATSEVLPIPVIFPNQSLLVYGSLFPSYFYEIIISDLIMPTIHFVTCDVNGHNVPYIS